MKKNMVRIAVLSLLATALAVAPSLAFAQATNESKVKKDKPAAGAPVEKAAKKQGVIPFRGKIAAVDKTAKTITVGERTFQVTSETKIMKKDKPATLSDAAVGDEIRGSYKKTDDGKLVAQRIWIGPQPQGTEDTKKEGGKAKKQ